MKQKLSLLELLSQPRIESRTERLYPFPHLWIQEVPKPQESDEEEDIDDLDAIPRIGRGKKDDWGAEETRKWLENRKLRFPIPSNAERLKDDDEYDMGVMEKKMRMKLELLKGTDESDYILRKRARYIKDLATVQRAKRKIYNQENHTENPVEVENPKEDPVTAQNPDTPKPTPFQPRTREEIIAHLKQKVGEDDNAIKGFIDNKMQHSSNYRYIQNTLFSNLVLDDVIQERENIMSILEYIHENNYLQD